MTASASAVVLVTLAKPPLYVPLEIVRLQQAFVQDLILEAIGGVPFSVAYAEHAVELGGYLKIPPETAGSLLHRVIQESREKVWEIDI